MHLISHFVHLNFVHFMIYWLFECHFSHCLRHSNVDVSLIAVASFSNTGQNVAKLILFHWIILHIDFRAAENGLGLRWLRQWDRWQTIVSYIVSCNWKISIVIFKTFGQWILGSWGCFEFSMDFEFNKKLPVVTVVVVVVPGTLATFVFGW